MSAPHLTSNEQHTATRLTAKRYLSAVERLLGVGLALLLLRSSFAHFGNLYYFLSTIYAYGLAGIEIGRWLAIVLPTGQMVIAVCLLFRWWMIEAYFLAFSMFVVFLGAQSWASWHGLDISCGCFGASSTLHVGATTMTVAAVGAVASLAGLLCTLQIRRRSGSASRTNGKDDG
jgi:hypothetical protein